MNSTSSTLNEPTETLDPDDWEEFRRIAHQAVDDMVESLRGIRERAAWRPVPRATKNDLDEPVPWDGQPLSEVYSQFKECIQPYPTGNTHPRFFGWVMGNGTPTGALADFLASWMNAHVAGYDQAASVIEDKVLDWLKELMGFPLDGSGLLVSGGTMANINALLVARNNLEGLDIRQDGLTEAPLTVYGSSETHSWVLKACEVMGLGKKGFRSVPVNDNLQVDCSALTRMIQQDIQSGFRPLALIGNAGTVSTGAIDDFGALRKIADDMNIWFHIDGAFGAMAAWGPESQVLVASQSECDSLAFDLHKWGYMPYEVACVLIKQSEAHTRTFELAPSYLTSSQRGISVETTRFADRGIQLSRGFRALKVWMSMKEQGVKRIGEAIDRNVAQARLLRDLVEAHDQLELLSNVSLNIVCFRYIADGLKGDVLNELNQELLLRIQESGFAVPSQTVLSGRFALRVCITNHRTTNDDIRGLVDSVVFHGKAICSEMRPT